MKAELLRLVPNILLCNAVGCQVFVRIPFPKKASLNIAKPMLEQHLIVEKELDTSV